MDCIYIYVAHHMCIYFVNIDYILHINIIGGYVHTHECGSRKTAFHVFINLSLCLSFVILRGIGSVLWLVGWLFPETGSHYVTLIGVGSLCRPD